MKTINAVGWTAVEIKRHFLLGIYVPVGTTQSNCSWLWGGRTSLAGRTAAPVVFHMEDNAHTVWLEWGEYLQR